MSILSTTSTETNLEKIRAKVRSYSKEELSYDNFCPHVLYFNNYDYILLTQAEAERIVSELTASIHDMNLHPSQLNTNVVQS